MKKLLVLTIILLLSACSLNNNPTDKVETYLDKYIELDDDVVEDMEITKLHEDLNNDNMELFLS